MALEEVIKCLDILIEYPAISDYIKNFDGEYGFMFTIETDPEKIQLREQMNTVLNYDFHSGASWACMLRMIKQVLNSKITREQIFEMIKIDTERAKAHAERVKAEAERAKANNYVNDHENSLYYL